MANHRIKRRKRIKVESKSLKDYISLQPGIMATFHEDCVNIIMEDLWNLMEPKYRKVRHFSCRGEISIYPFLLMGNSDHEELCIRRHEACSI